MRGSTLLGSVKESSLLGHTQQQSCLQRFFKNNLLSYYETSCKFRILKKSTKHLDILKNYRDASHLQKFELQVNTSNETGSSHAYSYSSDTLPCGNPVENRIVITVYGIDNENSGEEKSASTSLNRVEFTGDLSLA